MSSNDIQPSEHQVILVADVDGTLIKTDLLFETLLSAIKQKPITILKVPFWLLEGRPHLKERLAALAQISFDLIPLNTKAVEYLKSRAADGAYIVLASASHRSLVEAVAERIGDIQEVLASDGSTNCKGETKAVAIAKRFADRPWEYMGDSYADFKVWRKAAGVICVSNRPRFVAEVLSEFPQAHVIQGEPISAKIVMRALRVHQWMKNILVFVPLISAHRIFSGESWIGASIAAISFSLCASGVYLLNDLLDLDADRAHPRKRWRPCASGRLPLQYALAAAPVLFLSSLIVAMLAPIKFVGVLALYVVLTSIYSFKLKAVALVDIILLAMLYTIRIIGGGVASHIPVSEWLLALSMFFFLSLACVKRFSELRLLLERKERRSRGRGYSVEDLEQIAIFGSTSGYMSVLVLALYISSDDVTKLYAMPALVWLVCPLMLYWISRTWLLARRGLIHDDPLVFALTDKVTYAVGAMMAVCFAAATLL